MSAFFFRLNGYLQTVICIKSRLNGFKDIIRYGIFLRILRQKIRRPLTGGRNAATTFRQKSPRVWKNISPAEKKLSSIPASSTQFILTHSIGSRQERKGQLFLNFQQRAVMNMIFTQTQELMRQEREMSDKEAYYEKHFVCDR